MVIDTPIWAKDGLHATSSPATINKFRTQLRIFIRHSFGPSVPESECRWRSGRGTHRSVVLDKSELDGRQFGCFEGFEGIHVSANRRAMSSKKNDF